MREGVKGKTENVINTYPLRTLLGQFGDKTLTTPPAQISKGYNKLLKKEKKKRKNNPKITIVIKNVVKVLQKQWLEGWLVAWLMPANAAFIK